MVIVPTSDGANGVSNASQFFADIHKQFGVGNGSYVADMLKVLSSVTARLNCP